MTGKNWMLTLGVVVLGLSMVSLAEEAKKETKVKKEEKKVTIDQVPAAVKEAILKEAGKSEIKKIEEVTKGDAKVYKAEWMVDGKEVEVKLAADGKLLKKETETTLDKVPAAVKETIQKELGANKLAKVEEEVADGVTTYEAEWVVDGKTIELVVAADGKVVKKEEEKKGEGEKK